MAVIINPPVVTGNNIVIDITSTKQEQVGVVTVTIGGKIAIHDVQVTLPYHRLLQIIPGTLVHNVCVSFDDNSGKELDSISQMLSFDRLTPLID